MTRFTVPIKNILGKAYYRYEITSSNYNPSIDSTVTITVTCKNAFGSLISDKEISLYDNESLLDTDTTENGVATFSYTFNDWNKHNFKVEDATLQLGAKGFRLTTTKTNNVMTYKHYADESSRTCIITAENSNTFNIGTAEQYTFTGLIPSRYAPKKNIYGTGSRNANVLFYCWTGGSGGLYNRSTSSQTNQSFEMTLSYNY